MAKIEIDESSIDNFGDKVFAFSAKNKIPFQLDSVMGAFHPLLQTWLELTAGLQLMNTTLDNMTLLERCESPIEQTLVLALLTQMHLNTTKSKLFIALKKVQEQVGINRAQQIKIDPQFEINGYRVDFHIHFKSEKFEKRVLVECDGHDYHERTKEQAANDRSRDRNLQLLGFDSLRFTGSEIYNDPFKCTSEILNHLGATVLEIN